MIINSLLDTDFYKLLMHQFIWRNYSEVDADFGLINRTKSIKLSAEINISQLEDELDHVRSLKFSNNELTLLQHSEYYGQKDVFSAAYIDYLRHSFQLSDYTIDVYKGELQLTFHGKWLETTLWEIYALAIIAEMRTQYHLSHMSHNEQARMYARATTTLADKLEMLAEVEGLRVSDFGTRRRHSQSWHNQCILNAKEILGDKFSGTSNVLLGFQHNLPIVGTNAHELAMVAAAISKDPKEAQYEVLKHWQNMYRGPLLTILPDTFGTTQFLNGAPQWLDYWSGVRIDSKNPENGADEVLDWWNDRDPQHTKEKTLLFSDGLTHENIADLHVMYEQECNVRFGWGTNFTNDFREIRPISLVCKVKTANGNSAVKLSDNYEKATGTPTGIARYREIFGNEGMENVPVRV
jgi:nicotinate phosphoribosyltransferase